MRTHRFSLTAAAIVLAGVFATSSLMAQQPAPKAAPQAAPAPPPPQQGGPGQQPPLAPPKAYKPVAIKLPTPVADPSFAAFRKQLGDISQKKDRAALAKLVSQNFFLIAGEKDAADKKKPGIDNLSRALGLDG